MDLKSSPKIALTNRFYYIVFGVAIALLVEFVNIYFWKMDPLPLHRLIFNILFIGISFSFLAPFFSRLSNKVFVKNAMPPQLTESEIIENEGPVNFKKGKWYYVPGSIFVTNKNLIFKSIKKKSAKHNLIIPYESIQDIKQKDYPFSSNKSMLIKNSNGNEFEFVVNNIGNWLEEIQSRKNQLA